MNGAGRGRDASCLAPRTNAYIAAFPHTARHSLLHVAMGLKSEAARFKNRKISECSWSSLRRLAGYHPLLLDLSLADAAVAKGPPRRRCVANSLRILSVSSISLEPVFTSAMSSIFPLRASCAFVSNRAIGAPMARLIA